jgi:hypothetical protein
MNGSAAGRKRKTDLILKALTDPKFRKLLEKNPTKATGIAKPTRAQLKEVKKVLAYAARVEKQIGSLADELLCANGGCGIA